MQSIAYIRRVTIAPRQGGIFNEQTSKPASNETSISTHGTFAALFN